MSDPEPDVAKKLLEKIVVQAREVVTAWHEVARLDGPDRFARALEDLEQLVGRDPQ